MFFNSVKLSNVLSPCSYTITSLSRATKFSDSIYYKKTQQKTKSVASDELVPDVSRMVQWSYINKS